MLEDSSNPHQVAPATSTKPLGGIRAALFGVFAVSGIYFVLPVVAVFAVYLYALSAHGWSTDRIQAWLQDSTFAQFAYMVIVEALTFGVIILLLRLFRWNFKTIGLTKPKWFHPLVGAAALIPYLIIYVIMAVGVSYFVSGFDPTQKQVVGFDNVHTTVQLGMAFISLVVLPPLIEEITMRGFLYTSLRKWLPRIIAALVVSVLFGAAHLAEGGNAGPLWVGALDTFTLSLVLISLREATGNLWAGITLHALKNGIAFIALYTTVLHRFFL